MNKYEVVLHVDGEYVMKVLANSKEDAEEKARVECQESFFGLLEDAYWEPEYAVLLEQS